jgi:tetratricopeptide (TPR) repeat protein
MEVPFISACLIVRNEQVHLPRCLSALQGAVDEMVLVDTGSTDRTVAIAREFGARIFHFEWIDDFSAARNEALRHATGDWIIWIDADDELIESEPGALRRLAAAQREACPSQRGEESAPRRASSSPPAANGKNEQLWGYWLDVRCPYGDTGDQEVTVRQWRLFPNHRGIQFRGRIHEEAWPPVPIQPEQIASQSDVLVYHWGYAGDASALLHKSARNRRLLELAIADEPGNPLHYFNLGRQYLRQGDPAGASRYLDPALELWLAQGQPSWSFAHALFSFAGSAALQQELFAKVLVIESQCPGALVSSELLCCAGAAAWRLERRQEAIDRLERAWQDPTVVKPHLHDQATSTWQPLLMLSGLYDQVGRPDEGYRRARQAIALAPQHPEILLALGYLARRTGQPVQEQVRWLRQLLQGERDEGFKAQGRRLLLDIAAELDDPQIALEALAGELVGVTEEQRALMEARIREKLAA